MDRYTILETYTIEVKRTVWAKSREEAERKLEQLPILRLEGLDPLTDSLEDFDIVQDLGTLENLGDS